MVIEREPFVTEESQQMRLRQHVCLLWAHPFDQCDSSLILEVGVELGFHPLSEEPQHKLEIPR